LKKPHVQDALKDKKSECCHGTTGKNEVSFPTNIIDYKYISKEPFKMKVNINK